MATLRHRADALTKHTGFPKRSVPVQVYSSVDTNALILFSAIGHDRLAAVLRSHRHRRTSGLSMFLLACYDCRLTGD
jgi:hypothetical protein